ncbi:HD domain-containing protein [Haloferax sp. AB510]|uniref:HD domain-containing protein n=1 Tax=Haloferax sp. AB510 TaxID=2934172 RepID=UPI00209BD164|nr:HD domain-containing protein [Haloferax sp. AB510]MCO8268423.1 HD domain-containing protein [Haloferax sp. AB510]
MTGDLAAVLPEIEEIADNQLREKVQQSFRIGLEEGEFDTFTAVPWAPHHTETVGEQGFIKHTRDVTLMAIALADQLVDLRDIPLNRDHLIAGALVHDISKFFEYSGDSLSEYRTLLEHPHMCIYLLQKAEIPVHIQHIALSHTPQSSVAPQTIEAEIVQKADIIAMEGIFCEATGNITQESK